MLLFLNLTHFVWHKFNLKFLSNLIEYGVDVFTLADTITSYCSGRRTFRNGVLFVMYFMKVV
jgi:hypothetical protein